MQSPFDSPFDNMNNSTCCLYLEPMLNSYYKSYQNILTVSNVPAGPLASLIQRTSSPKLSQFQSMSAFSPPPTSRTLYSQICMLTLSRYPSGNANKYADNFMYASDIPNVIGYLENNGYKIMTDMTNLAFKGPVDFASASDMYGRNRKLVFMFKYEGK
jgi:hypothetical protein